MKGSSKPPPPPSARRPEPVKPRSARQLAGQPESPSPVASTAPEVVRFEADGVRWSVHAAGGSIGARRSGSAFLLLLRFTRGEEEREGSGPARATPPDPRPAASPADGGGASGDKQAWVPARALSDLSVEQLVEALRTARPWSDPDRSRPFFDDIGGQRRR